MLTEVFEKQQNKRFTLMKLSSEGNGKTKKCPINVRTGTALSWKKNPEDLLTWSELTSLDAFTPISADPSLPCGRPSHGELDRRKRIDLYRP